MKIRYLWKLLTVIKALCRVLRVAPPYIRPFVPDDKKSIFDERISQLQAACQLILNLDWLDGNPNTTDALGNPPE